MTLRMRAERYICTCGATQAPRAQGWQTLQQIFIDRPCDCRYVVVTIPSGAVRGIDLYDDLLVGPEAQMTLSQYTTYPDVDTAVATLSMQYP